MAKILIVIGIIAALAGAFFTWTISQQNAEVQTELKNALNQSQTAEEKAEGLQTNLTAKETELAETQEKVTALEGQIDETKKQLTDTEQKLTEASSKAEQASTQLTTVQSEFDEYKTKYSPDQIDTLSTQVTELNDKLARLETEKTQAQERVAELENLVAQAESQEPQQPAPGAEGQPSGPSGISSPAASGIAGQVQAVNEGWNFVVVNLGEADGITPNTKFNVYRDGRKVATLQAASVEPQVSTANVISNRRGIQPGDRVVTATPSA